MIHPFSLSPSLLTLNTLAGKKAELCIQTYPNLRITCATAYERRLPLNEHQCGDLCLKVSARTCQYNRMRRKSCVPSITPAIGSLVLLSDHCNSGLPSYVTGDVTSERPAHIAPSDKKTTNVGERGKSVERGNKSIVNTSKSKASALYYYSPRNEQQHHFRAAAGLSNSALEHIITKHNQIVHLVFRLILSDRWCSSD
ncbi:Uncharacterized protein BM_BM17982 [Brugia malayi]|uniref:Uncharacterized protein n=1 Tax=Brugia malayi TaxID=6279 RepID=A0A4E9EVW7_BRUMA|nr:Uncharacterized protein BM_BM17982 [Brugia malayi]VIO88039.1 Uncharacterized protein BM_BM17982 [Brugia malayi]